MKTKEENKMKKVKYFKMAQADGWDFYTGKTINYRQNIGRWVSIPDTGKYELCSPSVIHASINPNDCFVGVKKLPVSCFVVEGKPVVEGKKKSGFVKLGVIEEIPQKKLDELLGWKYIEGCSPVNPLLINSEVTAKDWKLLKNWASVGDSVEASVKDSVWASVKDSVWASVEASVKASVKDSVWVLVEISVWASVWASVETLVEASVEALVGDSDWVSVRDSVEVSAEASVWAYIGSIFPGIKEWEYCNFKYSGYPFQPAVDLWRRGFVPVKVKGKKWVLWNQEKGIIKQEAE